MQPQNDFRLRNLVGNTNGLLYFWKFSDGVSSVGFLTAGSLYAI